MGIPASTLRSRLEAKNLTPDDIEKLADYFEKPIAYYFDREEKETIIYKHEDKMQVVKEDGPCLRCGDKDKLIAAYEKQIELLEFQLGKNLKTGSE